MGLSWDLCCWWQRKWALEQWWAYPGWVHPDNANHFAAVFLWEMQGPSTSSGSTVPPWAIESVRQQSCLQKLSWFFIKSMHSKGKSVSVWTLYPGALTVWSHGRSKWTMTYHLYPSMIAALDSSQCRSLVSCHLPCVIRISAVHDSSYFSSFSLWALTAQCICMSPA